MDLYWNKLHLEHPPSLTCRVEQSKIDVDVLISSIVTAIQDLQCQNFLHTDAAILSRLIYRMKCKFRTNKSFRKMEQVKRGLLNYLSLSLDKEYKNLKNCIERDGNLVILPSKQMLEYVLVRTIGFAKLMIRVEEVIRSSALLLKERITEGHSWAVAMVAYAVIGRLWILSRYLIKKSCTWYANLYGYLNVFKSVSLPWLPEDQPLPPNLGSWLDISWINEETSKPSKNDQCLTSMFKLLKSGSNVDLEKQPVDSKELYEKIDDVGEQINRCTFTMPKTSRLNKSSIKILDSLLKNHDRKGNKRSKNLEEIPEADTSKIEDPIPRKRKRITCSEIKKNDKTCISLEDVKTKSDLIKFLNQDQHSGMDKLKWNIIKNKCTKLLNRIEECSNSKKQHHLMKKTIKYVEKLID